MERSLDISRIVRRTPAAILWPAMLTLLCLAAPFVAAAWSDGSEAKADQSLMIAMLGAASAIAAILLEVGIRRQIALVRDGRFTRGMVDEVETDSLLRLSRTHRNAGVRIRYHFITAEGKLIDGVSRINELDGEALSRGSAVEIFYDPQRPRRNSLMNTLWAVTWQAR